MQIRPGRNFKLYNWFSNLWHHVHHPSYTLHINHVDTPAATRLRIHEKKHSLFLRGGIWQWGNEEIGESSCDGDLCGGVMAEEGKVALVFGIYANTQILGLKNIGLRKRLVLWKLDLWGGLKPLKKKNMFLPPQLLLDLNLKSWHFSCHHFSQWSLLYLGVSGGWVGKGHQERVYFLITKAWWKHSFGWRSWRTWEMESRPIRSTLHRC